MASGLPEEKKFIFSKERESAVASLLSRFAFHPFCSHLCLLFCGEKVGKSLEVCAEEATAVKKIILLLLCSRYLSELKVVRH